MSTASASSSAPPRDAGNAELIRWAFGVLNTHDVTPLRDVWTPGTIEHFPNGTCIGTEEIAAYFEEAFAAVPDFHMEVQSIVESGEEVMIRWRLTGTHSGAAWQGIAPTGKPFTLDGIDHFVVRDGKIVSNFVVFDQMQFARAVGLLPVDGSAADRAVKAGFGALIRLRQRLNR